MDNKAKQWSDGDIQQLTDLYRKKTLVADISKIMGRTEGSIRNKAWRLGITDTENRYTDEEIKYLIDNYSSERLQEVANHLGRHKTNVCRKAKQLGLDVNTIDFDNLKHFKDEDGRYRKLGWERETPEEKRERLSEQSRQAYKDNPNLKVIISKRAKERIKRNGHPRGMLGKTHSKEYRKQISKRMIEAWEDENSVYNSEENKQRLSDLMKERRMIMTVTNPYSRTKSGKREDLDNRFFRSSWEANYARYLNYLLKKKEIYKWEYEADRFEFVPIKRGTRTYTPDFKIWKTKESTPFYVEIKGWMDDKSKTRLKRMAKYYPDVELILVQSKEYKQIEKRYSKVLENWE